MNISRSMLSPIFYLWKISLLYSSHLSSKMMTCIHSFHHTCHGVSMFSMWSCHKKTRKSQRCQWDGTKQVMVTLSQCILEYALTTASGGARPSQFGRCTLSIIPLSLSFHPRTQASRPVYNISPCKLNWYLILWPSILSIVGEWCSNQVLIHTYNNDCMLIIARTACGQKLAKIACMLTNLLSSLGLVSSETDS